MRHASAPYIEEEAVYARRPFLGFTFQLIGYLLLSVTVLRVLGDQGCCASCPMSLSTTVGSLMGFTFFVWLIAWYTAVGSLWRSVLTATLLTQAVILSAVAMGVTTIATAAACSGGAVS